MLSRAYGLQPSEIARLTIDQLNAYLGQQDLPDYITLPDDRALARWMAEHNA